MGFLEDLKAKLTTPGGEAFSSERFQSSRPKYLEGKAPADSQTSDVVPPYLFDAAAAARRRRRRTVFGVLLLFGVFLVAGGTYLGIRWYQESRTVQKHHILLTVEAPEKITSGEDVNVRVALENASRVGWENVQVELQLPEGFALKSSTPAPVSPLSGGDTPVAPGEGKSLVWAVGTLPTNASTEFQIVGRLFGEEGNAALFSAKTLLTPENRPDRRQDKSTLASVVLAEIPIDLTLDVPREAASGTPITIRIVYQNRLSKDLTGARLVLEAPAGFKLRSTDPPVSSSGELTWELPALPPQAQGTISVTGIIEGSPETVNPFTANVGFVLPDGRFLVQRQVQRSLVIEKAGLTITQLFNDVQDPLKVNPGAEVSGRVLYKNTGTRGLREVIVRLTFEGIGLDARAVRVTGGFFDSTTKTITWSAASSPELRVLRPGDSGELKFLFRILPPEALPFTGDADRNFTLMTRAIGDSPDLPTPPGAPKQVATSQYEMLLNTVPSLDIDAFSDDGRAGLPRSTGPMPPRVGEETVLTVRARVGNTSNEIIDATYRTVLPEGVRWVGSEYHTTGRVSFNERTRDVIWSIPVIAARAGAALPGPEFGFQVAIVPSLNQVGAVAPLTRGHVVEGTDAFTTVRVRAEAAAVTTGDVDPRKGEVVR